ncbi:type VI secretion system accessory protein TagJ [Sphingomonas sp.]|jgi:type VI secretion system protein ImpE|uniref:type VI secretion system accessory protein TagJ n=1 Tax=Sphingomonas sp. TaxID=28214 RepID=UPI002D7EEB55|nr:type VI secretion system accessory protein TagJ [Sphingomonas sp.]HEU0044673.1 type VI secretion system accessory protein TagJ [Sphingomonas sp.]
MATDADQLLRAGDLDGARRALVEVVRAKPSDEGARMFLFQLLAIAGEWDKARTQLSLLAQLSPEAQMLSTAYGQALEAERERADVFAGKTRMQLLLASDWAEGLCDAIQLYGNGRADEGSDRRDAAFEAAPDTPGALDGTAFDWIGDADSRFGPSLEAIIGGRYGLVPFDTVASIKSEGPKDLRDTVWYPVQLAFKSGQSVAALLPTRYPGSEASNDVNERLGRATRWRDTDWGQVGSGQHLWALSSEDERDLLSVRHLVFA